MSNYRKLEKISFALRFALVFSCGPRTESTPNAIEQATAEPWSRYKAWDWYNMRSWLVGSNFDPSTAINQLEFWHHDIFRSDGAHFSQDEIDFIKKMTQKNE